MKLLFSPFKLRHLELPNRIVMPPLASFLIEQDGSVSQAAVEHYRMRASGGPGMIIMEACAVSPEGVVSRHQARIDEDRHVEGLSKVAEAIKREGVIPAVQLHHAGRQTSIKVIGQRPKAPSPLPCPTIKGEVDPLSKEEIALLVHKFGLAARRAKEAGFELIEIHGAHGYLVNQFLSRFSNIREDEYGGSIENRARFAKEIILELRKVLGPEFPISFKISAQEFSKNGLTTQESIELLKIIVEAGVDVVQVSAGNDATPEWICQPMLMPQACLADSAYEVKKALNVPVMAVGRINDPLLAERLLALGKADLICIGRGLIADPELPKKARENRLDEIRRCVACNTCMQSIFKRGRVECLVNPSVGREKEMAIVPAKETKKIMVVGGGPGGLNFAWVAAKRGHEVYLYEREGQLGGQLRIGAITSFKREMNYLLQFLITQAKKHGVSIHTNSPVDINKVKELGPDVVVLATGSVPSIPPIPGVDLSHVLTPYQALDSKDMQDKEVVIVGGGATGCEIAIHLMDQGARVSIVEIQKEIGTGFEALTRKILLTRLREKGARLYTQHSPLKIDAEGLWVANQEDQKKCLPADYVVISIGTKSNDSLFDEIKEAGFTVYKIGDCLEPRNAKSAIYESAVLARSI